MAIFILVAVIFGWGGLCDVREEAVQSACHRSRMAPNWLIEGKEAHVVYESALIAWWSASNRTLWARLSLLERTHDRCGRPANRLPPAKPLLDAHKHDLLPATPTSGCVQKCSDIPLVTSIHRGQKSNRIDLSHLLPHVKGKR